jgi:hypothetical protein
MPLTQKFAYLFSTTLGLSILIYLLRGFQVQFVTAIMPGGILLGLIILAIATFFIYSILITKR